VTGGLGPVAAGRHVTPASTAILGPIEKHTAASWITAASDAAQLTGDQRVCAIVDNRHHERCERIAAGDEVSSIDAIR